MGLREQQLCTYESIKPPRPQDKVYHMESKPQLYNIACQTAYRESEAQTTPWMPPYKVIQCKTPEVLTLACLSFDNRASVTKHDVEILQRLRKKRGWENYLSYIYTPENEEYRHKVIMELEKNEWEFREKEINEINELRIELAQQQMLEQRMIVQERLNHRIKRVKERSEAEKRVKLPKIKAECSRALRMTHQRLIGLNKFKRLSIIDEFTDLSSNLYAPLAMHGRNAANGHEKLCIDPRPKKIGDIYNALWKGISTTPLPQMKGRHVKKHCCKTVKFRDIPDTRIVQKVKHYDKLNKQVGKKFIKPLACVFGEIDEEEEEVLKNVALLQSIIKGRAVQSMVLRHFQSNRDLVFELKSTIGLNPCDKKEKIKDRKDILKSIRDYNTAMRKKEKIIGLVEKLQGHTISTMLDYTSKALGRLEDEKRAHLYALAAERDRWARESSEAGRRQQEEIRQRQHEEIYKQIIKIHEISSDVFLEDTIEEQAKDTSKALASTWAEEHAKDVNDIVDLSQLEEFEQMEHLTQLYNQFIFDEDEKAKIRDVINAKTAAMRKYAETVIYSTKSHLMEEDSLSLSDLSAQSEIRHLCKTENDEEEKECSEFHNEILDNPRVIKQIATGDIDKIQRYEDIVFVPTLMVGDQNNKTKSEHSPEAHSEIKIIQADIGEKPLEKSVNDTGDVMQRAEDNSMSDRKKKMLGIFKKSPKCTNSGASILSKKKQIITELSSTEDEESLSILKYLDSEVVDFAKKCIKDPVSIEIESSEKEIIPKELENADRRRQLYEVEEKQNCFKKMAQKLLDQIVERANIIANRLQEVSKDVNAISYNEARADALLQAYQIVSKALLTCSDNSSYDCVEGNLKTWLNTVLGVAEKRVFDLFDILNSQKSSKIKEEKKNKEETEIEEEECPIEESTVGLDRLKLIPEAVSGAHIFKGSPYWCPEIFSEAKSIESETVTICDLEEDRVFTDEEVKRLKYVGILEEKRLTYLPGEESFKQLPTVIKTRRSYPEADKPDDDNDSADDLN